MATSKSSKRPIVMTHLVSTAAYIRKDARHPTRDAEPAYTPLERELWELLRTPNTIDSLCRALTHTAREKRDDLQADVTDVLQQWIDSDLVELSPDS